MNHQGGSKPYVLMLCCKVPWPLHDGGAIVTRQAALWYSQMGYDVLMACIAPKSADFQGNDVEALRPHFLENVTFKLFPHDTSVTVFGAIKSLLDGTSYNIVRFENEAMFGWVQKQTTKAPPEIVHIDSIFMTSYVEFIDRKAKIPTLLRQHNVEYLIWEALAKRTKGLKSWYLGLLAKRLKRDEQMALTRFDAVITITSNDAKEFKKMGYRGPIVVLPIAVEPKVVSEVPQNQSIGFLGSMDWMPNQEGIEWLLKEVWPLVRRVVPAAELSVAGRNMPSHLKSIPSKSVHIVGQVDNAQSFLSRHRVLVSPLLSGSGMRVKIVEGMAVGRPMVSTSVGAEGLPQDLPGLHIGDTPDNFAAKIITMLDDYDFAKTEGQKASESISNSFGAAKVSSDFSDFLSQNGLLQLLESK